MPAGVRCMAAYRACAAAMLIVGLEDAAESGFDGGR